MAPASRRIGPVVFVFAALLLTGFGGSAPPPGPSPTGTQYRDAEGLLARGARAVVWYLGHSGWAVRTRDHLLIFDYWEYHKRSGFPASARLADGFVDPAEIADAKVRVFVSHGHSDHYDPVIHSWKDRVPDLQYVFGWEPEGFSPDVAFGPRRETKTLGDLTVTTVHHAFDGVPESAFLVEADGLVLYHAGDHGHPDGRDNPEYKANIDFLASLHRRIDLAFLPLFGGADYAIERLRPRAAAPMHESGHEAQYAKFAREARRRHPGVKVFAAAAPGDSFEY